MDYNIPDLIGNGSGEMKSKMNLKDAVDNLDISLICKRFPSISLGSAPQVDLYDGTTSNSETTDVSATVDFEEHFYASSEARLVQNTVSEAPPSLYVDNSSAKYSLTPHSVSSIYDKKLDPVTGEDSQLSLDQPINCFRGLSKRQYQQLDICGFHTVGTQNSGLWKMCRCLDLQF